MGRGETGYSLYNTWECLIKTTMSNEGEMFVDNPQGKIRLRVKTRVNYRRNFLDGRKVGC